MNQNFLSLLDKKLPNGTVSHALEVPLGGTCVSRKDALYTVVGASVAVCLIDTETAWCSLRQVMLPSLARGHRQDAMLQADAALEDALTRLYESAGIDAEKFSGKRIKAKLFGGSDLKATGISYSDGEQSTSFVRSWLSTRHIAVAAESLGGRCRREIVLLPGNGVVYCRKLELDDAFLDSERNGLTPDRKDESRIELF
jgi:chemotaxis protein CheD